MNYNELAIQIYEQNKIVGWWDDPNRCIYETLQLVSTEIAEATEGERKVLFDVHLPMRWSGEVELADTLIRVLDVGGRFGLYYTGVTSVREIDVTGWSVGRRHFYINGRLMAFGSYLHDNRFEVDKGVLLCYAQLIDSIVLVAESFGYDLEGATREKLAYNKTREDHKRENRAKKNGKRF